MVPDSKKPEKSKTDKDSKASKPKPVPAKKPTSKSQTTSKKTVKKPKPEATKKPVKKKDKVATKAKKEKKGKDDKKVEIVDEEMDEEEEEEVEAEIHLAKLKPKLDKGVKAKLRQKHRRKKPKFRRQEWFRYKRLGKSWRRPKGLHSKMRTNKKYRPNVVRIGYGSPKLVRGLHPSGFKEVMVYNVNDLEGVDPKTEAVRIGHSVGTKKRIELEKKADKLGIRVLNRGA
jgi:large subunit ribosomal protein L32e